MIPHELQAELDQFAVKWEEHCKRRLNELNQKFDNFEKLIAKLDGEFLDNALTVLYKEDWIILRGWIADLDKLIFDMQMENGSRCAKCYGWIEEKLSAAKNIEQANTDIKQPTIVRNTIRIKRSRVGFGVSPTITSASIAGIRRRVSSHP